MKRLAATSLLALACLSMTGRAPAAMKSATERESYRETVKNRLCFAGRFKFEERLAVKDLYTGRFVEQIASGAGHPNAEKLGDKVRVVLYSAPSFHPEVGKTYCLILTGGSMLGMTVEGYGPDDPATLKEMKEVVESPTAFVNSETWIKRRALWARFKQTQGPGETPLVYAEDDSLQYILYVKRGASDSPVHRFSARSGKSESFVLQKVIRGVNRISYEDGAFQVWFNGSIELTIAAGG